VSTAYQCALALSSSSSTGRWITAVLMPSPFSVSSRVVTLQASVASPSSSRVRKPSTMMVASASITRDTSEADPSQNIPRARCRCWSML
jgi:hypothetical protein